MGGYNTYDWWSGYTESQYQAASKYIREAEINYGINIEKFIEEAEASGKLKPITP